MKIILLLTFLLITFSFPGYAGQEPTLYPVLQSGHWGYMDKTGKVVIQPQFDKADVFHEGLAPVKIGKRIGYIDTTGKIVINPQFDDGWAFSDGIAAVKVGDKFGYIDRTGKYVWEPRY